MKQLYIKLLTHEEDIKSINLMKHYVFILNSETTWFKYKILNYYRLKFSMQDS